MTTYHHFIHGSTATPQYPSEFKFQLFNYTLGHNGEKNCDQIHNGLDAEGPGIYAFLLEQENKQDILNNVSYYSQNTRGNGSIIGFHYNTPSDEFVLANDQSQDAISKDEWCEVIERFIDKLNHLYNYHPDDVDFKLNNLINYWDTHNHPPCDEMIKSFCHSAKIPHNEVDVSSYKTSNDLYESLIEQVTLYKPSTHIDDEGGIDAIIEYAIDTSYDLWEVVCNLYSTIAVINTAQGYQSYNLLFHDAVFESIDTPELLSVAKAPNDNFYIIFNTNNITIDMVKQSIVKTNEPQYEQFVNEFIDNAKTYYNILTTEQLQQKHHALIQKTFGKTCSNNTLDKLLLIKNKEAFYPSLHKQLRTEIGCEIETLYERISSVSSRYLPNLPTKTSQEQVKFPSLETSTYPTKKR